MKRETAIKKGLERLEKKLGLYKGQLRQEIYRDVDNEYNTEDVVMWLDENGYAYTKKDIPIIVEEYQSDYDCDRGTWDNIESAVYYLSDCDRMSVKFRTKNGSAARLTRLKAAEEGE